MASSYSVDIPEVGKVRVQKRKGMKSIRLRVTPRGELVVSAPWYVPRSIITTFLHERGDWMKHHSTFRRVVHKDKMLFGKNLQLHIVESAPANRTKIQPSQLFVYLKDAYDPTNSHQQKIIEQKMIKAMQVEAEHVLLPELHALSKQTGVTFNQAYIKNLTGRWGSCDSQKNILLSVFMVQLPGDLRGYVMLHELVHTLHMNHSPKFWQTVEQYCPDYKLLRKNLKEYDPRVTARISS